MRNYLPREDFTTENPVRRQTVIAFEAFRFSECLSSMKRANLLSGLLCRSAKFVKSLKEFAEHRPFVSGSNRRTLETDMAI